jgi:TolB-like protein/DNA-binding winged helix-turn-helix (wHTH) protein
VSESEQESDESGGASERVLTAGPYRLDLRDERVWKDGEPLRLGGKAFTLLRTLMASPQTLVTKDELFEKVWGGLAVSESVLTTAVKELRQALGDDARRPTVIETVHGRGYRFLLPVTRDTPADDAPPDISGQPPAGTTRARTKRWMAAAAAVAVTFAALVAVALANPATFGLAHPKSVAVLPFEDLSPDGAERWFAEGLTEEVTSTLARTRDLRVAAPGSVGAPDGDLRRAAREAGVAHVLTGAVRRSGDRLRVTADLVRASDGAHIWSQSYDRKGGDIISIQEDISVQIARALKTATDPARLQAMTAAGTRSVPAYEAYLRGLVLQRRQLDEGDVALSRAAEAAFEEAVRLDPTFSAAQWRVADRLFGNATRVDAPTESDAAEAARLKQFFARADAAIVNSQDETESLKYRATRAAMQLRFQQARRLMADYVRARPRDIEAWDKLAEFSAYAGEREEMARAARRIRDLSFEAGQPRSRAVTLLVMGGRLDEALALARRQVQARPDSALILYQAHRAAIWAGRTPEAEGYLKRLRNSGLPRESKLLAELRQACAAGRLTDASATYEALRRAQRRSTRYHAAQIYGDEATAVRTLAPLDTPERLPVLMQFLIHPTFDARPYPNLRARLEADGATIRRPIATPNGCPARR